MKTNANRLLALVPSVIFALAITTGASFTKDYDGQGELRAPVASYVTGNASVQKSGRFDASALIRLADGHADICMANYTQCMQGCDGAASCSNQCQVNYDGCMGQNQ